MEFNPKTLSDEQLEEARQSITEESERRREKFTLDRIKPGMLPEEEAAALAEIRRVFGGPR